MKENPLQDRSPASLGIQAMMAAGGQIADDVALAANAGDALALGWISRLERYGVTDSLLKEIRGLVHEIQITTRPEIDPSKQRFYWIREFPGDNDIPTIEAAYAFLIVRIINAGLVKNLKRCPLKRCRNYFFGDPRTRWCSNTCGSFYRVTLKRNPKKARGLI